MHTTSDVYQRLAIDVIRQDGGTQPRATVNEDWVADYAADMQSGAKFPPVVVFFDGASYWLADGYHRVGAAVASGLTEIEADVRQGTRRDAVLFSVGANAQHGHRRTNEDKRRAVDVVLNDSEWAKSSDREIARQCGVSNRFVSNMRHDASVNGSQIDGSRLATRGGTTYEMQTNGIGQRGTVGSADKPSHLKRR